MKKINLNKDFIINNFEQLKEIKKGCKIEEFYPWTLENFLLEIHNKWKYSLIGLSENNKILGYIIASEKNLGNIHIHSWYTGEEYRGKGVGARLFAALHKEAKKNDIKTMSIWAYEKTPAYGFYKKLGFIETGERIKVDLFADYNVFMTAEIKLLQSGNLL